MSRSNPPFDVEVTSNTTVFPSSLHGSEQTTPLSIVDNTVAKFARCAAIWYLEASTNSVVTSTSLRDSLSNTLTAYPHLSGRLTWSHPYKNIQGYSSRYRRAHVTYNTQTDIGVPFVTATTQHTLSRFLPSAVREKAWEITATPSSKLIPPSPLSLSQEGLPAHSPNMVVQYTTFSCGGTAISISITHGLSDAQTLSNFANDWSAVSRAMLSNSPLPILSPVFDPQLLNSRAAGDINAAVPDPTIQKAARELPMHRFDWYAQVPDQPWGDRRPSDLPRDLDFSTGVPIPWEQWDVNLPVSSYVLHFTSEQVQKIFDAVNQRDDGISKDDRISKHDALIAHLWSRISIARGKRSETESHLNFSLGLRQRLGLSEKFVGSPITLAALSSSSTSPSVLAEKINSTLKKFNADSIGNLLYDEAFEVDPQRIWRGCLGNEHVMVTSWIYSGVEEVDFGNGKVRWVQPVMSPFDGLCAVMEGLGAGHGHWARYGVDIWVSLEKGAMEKLVRDSDLWVPL